MMRESGYVSRIQCMVRIRKDGTPTLVGCGKAPTLVRTRNGPWNPLYNRQEYILSDGDQVSLDANDPEGAVFTLVDDMQQGGNGGYGGGFDGGYGGGYGGGSGGYSGGGGGGGYDGGGYGGGSYAGGSGGYGQQPGYGQSGGYGNGGYQNGGY